MLVASEPDSTIRQISANSEIHFGATPESLRGKTLNELLGENDFQLLQQKILPQPLEANPVYLP